MMLEILQIAALTVGVAGLVPVLSLRDTRRRVALVIMVSVMLASTALALERRYRHLEKVNHTEVDILDKLRTNMWAFDQIHEEIECVDPEITSEALSRAVEERKVAFRWLVLRRLDGETMRVRAYYASAD